MGRDRSAERREELERRRDQLAEALRELGRRERLEKIRYKQLYRSLCALRNQQDEARTRGDAATMQRLQTRLTELERQRDEDQRGRILTEYNRVLEEKYQVEAELRRIGGASSSVRRRTGQ